MVTVVELPEVPEVGLRLRDSTADAWMSQTSVEVGEEVGVAGCVGVGEAVGVAGTAGVGVGVDGAGAGGRGAGAGGLGAGAGGRGAGAGGGAGGRGAGGGGGGGGGLGAGGGAGGGPIRKETEAVVEPPEPVVVAVTVCDPAPAPEGTVNAVDTFPEPSGWQEEEETTTVPSKVTVQGPVTLLRFTVTRVPADPELGEMLMPSARAGEARSVTKDATRRVNRTVETNLPPARYRCVLIIRQPRH